MEFNKVSIITLTYKNWHLLDKAVKSVASQVVDDKYQIEYLIVDDGTDDFDVEYVDNLLRDTDLNYRIIVNNKNIGTVASFNNAIKQSAGDIIVPLSADDEFYDPYVVNDILNEFVRTNSYVITGLRIPIINGADGKSLPSEKFFCYFNNSQSLLMRILVHGNIISGASTYYHRDVFHMVGLFNDKYRLLEDYPFYIKLLSHDVSISLYKRKVVKYGLSGVSSKANSMLRSDYLLLYRDILRRNDLSLYQKRYIKFSRLMTRKEKLKNALLYPEQIVIYIILWFLSRAGL